MTEQREFVVRWEIPITATTPQEAAEQAHEIMIDPDWPVEYFEVFWGDPETAEMTEVILGSSDPLEDDTDAAYRLYEETGDERLRTVM